MYLIVNPDGVLQEPILLFLHPVCLKLLLADFTQLQKGGGGKTLDLLTLDTIFSPQANIFYEWIVT